MCSLQTLKLSRRFMPLLFIITGFLAAPAVAQVNLATTVAMSAEAPQVITLPSRAREANAFNLAHQEGSVTTVHSSLPAAASKAEVEYKAAPDKTSINIVAEVGIRTTIIEAPTDPWQPQGIIHARVSVEWARPGKILVPYVAVGMWDNLKGGWSGPITPAYTKFAVVGLAFRSSGHPKTGQVVFQANLGAGLTWDRDRVRTSAGYIFELQASASYYVSRRMAVRAGYAHYSTGEGNILSQKANSANAGEGRLTFGLTLRV